MYCLSTFGLSTIWWVMVSSVTSYVLPMQTDLSQDTWPPKHLEVDGGTQTQKTAWNWSRCVLVSPCVETHCDAPSPNDKSQRLSGCFSVKKELEPLKDLFLSLLLLLFLLSGLHVLHVLLKKNKGKSQTLLSVLVCQQLMLFWHKWFVK